MHDSLSFVQKQLTPWPSVFPISYSVVLKDTQGKKYMIEWERERENELEEKQKSSKAFPALCV